MFKPSDLHVFAALSNLLHYKAPHQNWERFAEHMLDAGVTLIVIECAFGDEDHVRDLDGMRPIPIPVRAKTRLWTKENGGGPVATEPKVRFRLETGPSGETRRTAHDPLRWLNLSPDHIVQRLEPAAPLGSRRSGSTFRYVPHQGLRCFYDT